MTKGCYGYLARQKKKEILKTILFFAIPLSLFAIGYLTTGSKKNLLTVVAVLGFLPACKSMVSMIMYLKAGTCSRGCYEAVQQAGITDLPILHDLYLTSYRHNFQISAMAIKNRTVCGYTEDDACDLSAGEKHITEMLGQSGYSGLTVKLFRDLNGFTDRLTGLCAMPEKTEEKDAAIAEIIKDISL